MRDFFHYFEGQILDYIVPDRPEHSEIIKKPLSELKFPEGALVGAVIHEDSVAIASGQTVFEAGDDLLIVTLPEAIDKVEKLLA